MSDIATYLSNILSAIRGEDVRQSIHDAIQACYEDGQSGATDLIARQQIETLQTRINNQYPVGAIYISTNNTNPSTYFGGTWAQIAQGRTLIGVGSIEANTIETYGTVTAGAFTPAANDRGGELTHTLNVNEIPSHTHSIGYGTNFQASTGAPNPNSFGSTNFDPRTSATGGGQAHNNIMPYLAVYIWQRTA